MGVTKLICHLRRRSARRRYEAVRRSELSFRRVGSWDQPRSDERYREATLLVWLVVNRESAVRNCGFCWEITQP